MNYIQMFNSKNSHMGQQSSYSGGFSRSISPLMITDGEVQNVDVPSYCTTNDQGQKPPAVPRVASSSSTSLPAMPRASLLYPRGASSSLLREAIWLFYSFGGSSVIINNPQQNGKHQQKERSNATLFQEENCFGVRMIVGHHCGNFIKAQTLVHQGVPEPHKAESWGLLQAESNKS
ncbi:hypothetical protein JHK82_045281 [Glycine max]|nr:hypothetical protein JHK82_045281 [Glycine max]